MQEADKALLKKFLNKNFTTEEYERIQELLRLPETQEVLEELTWNEWEHDCPSDELPSSAVEKIRQNLFSKIIDHKSEQSFFPVYKLMRYAAIFIGGMLAVGFSWYIIHKNTNEDQQFATHELLEQEIIPGSDKALLTLADGSTISLSDADNGMIVEQAGVAVRKTTAGEIIYQGSSKTSVDEKAMNSIITPNGGQYRITLPDGSKAWLNAASSLTYPVLFSKNERRVKMTGEVYFEIAKLKKQNGSGNVPFIVETDRQKIQVLGTQFNVNAYTDEPHIRTTLVEGSVQVTSSANGESVLLKPGQQAIFKDRIRVERADIQQELAWKNGKFIYKGEHLASILRQVSRWYDLDIECPQKLGQLQFSGIILRSTSLSSIIKMIETTEELNITVKGRRLIVSE